MVPDDRRHLYTWDADSYYSKDQIDNQFTLRGVGYTYLLSSISGSVTIRPGEMHTNNRLVGQITFISMGEVDENGKQRRSPVVGDLIELVRYYNGKVLSLFDQHCRRNFLQRGVSRH